MPGTSGSQDDQRIIPKIIIKKEVDDISDYPSSNVNWWMKEELKPELDLDIEEPPSDMFSYRSLLDVPESINLFDNQFSDTSYDKLAVKQECESDEENSNLSKPVGMSKKFLHPDTSRKRKAVTKDESPVKENVSQDSKYEIMSPYEEEQLLEKLKNYPAAMSEKPELRRLYRKLVVRKLKREYKLPVFDIDAEVRTLRGIDPPEGAKNENDTNLSTQELPKMTTILDRYQIGYANVQGKSQQRVSFFTRLMGLDEEELMSIVSPYTERILKPFIFRDYTLKPPKLLLLEELLQHTNRNNPDWQPPQHSPIDYCYVRPQHIPAINAMCREFFWPGIDMSESLQYPDFSCVALYKKVIIGFAFMVPDVKYNEAYITFIFCHPDWRRCGISTFMLYHLIQTCMGKDVTLHVSATSTAVFLYQKFGFKVEEYIRDFYDKYLPADSKECRHALFLRLSR